ncbi:MAG: TadE/TadG family type IV pilus assembly protein [Geminicoccaceae bacterium]
MKPPPHLSQRPAARALALCRRFVRSRHAISAVEFALLGPIFLSLVVAMMELGLFYGNRAIVDHAVQRGARTVRVGYVGGVRTTKPAFEQALCSGLVMISCTELSYTVEAHTSFTSMNHTTALDTDGTLAATTFDLGGPSDTVIVTAAYTHSFVSPFGAGFLLPDGAGSTTPIIAHVVIKNEPFPLP